LAKHLLSVHFRFVWLRWRALESYLSGRFRSEGKAILEVARRRAAYSLRSATRYLSGEGVSNVHRFLYVLPINSKLERALQFWTDDFDVKKTDLATRKPERLRIENPREHQRLRLAGPRRW
jgi:hypothetical protein